MAYTPENIRNIKRDGLLDAYIAQERGLIDAIDKADVIDEAHGEHTAAYAHLAGGYGTDFEDGGRNVIVWLSYDGDWSRKFSLASFDGDFKRAFAYARATLRNKLIEDGKSVRATAKARLSSLEAAQEA